MCPEPEDYEAPDYSVEVQERIDAMSYSELRDACCDYYHTWAWAYPAEVVNGRGARTVLPRPAGGFSEWLRDRIAADVARHYRAMREE